MKYNFVLMIQILVKWAVYLVISDVELLTRNFLVSQFVFVLFNP